VLDSVGIGPLHKSGYQPPYKSIGDGLIYHATYYNLVTYSSLEVPEEEKGMLDPMPSEMLLIAGWMSSWIGTAVFLKE